MAWHAKYMLFIVSTSIRRLICKNITFFLLETWHSLGPEEGSSTVSLIMFSGNNTVWDMLKLRNLKISKNMYLSVLHCQEMAFEVMLFK